MRPPRRSKQFRRSAASLLVSTALLTSVGGSDAMARFALTAGTPELSGGTNFRQLVSEYVASEPLVAFEQQVEPRVVLRPLHPARDRANRVDAKGKNLWQVSRSGSNDVPTTAVHAYRRAASVMRAARPACQIPWTLLAGIGRVESDHGRYGGSVLGDDGLPRPAIRGIALNGVGPVAAIGDSDNGRFDGDKVWDRAVGPMQFIPTTWEFAGRDGDRDGVANPNDIDDAALAAAAYLCPDGGTKGGVAVWREQVFRYNHSDYYVDLVMAFEKGYRTGSFVIPSPPPPPEPEPVATQDRHRRHHKRQHAEPGKQPSAPHKQPAHQPAHQPTHQPTHQPAQPPTQGSGGSGGSTPAQPPKSPKPPKPPKPPTPPKPPKPPTPTPTPSPTPTPTPTPTPAPTPSEGPSEAPVASSGPTAP